MNAHENNLFVSWGTTVGIGLLIGAGLGYVFSMQVVYAVIQRMPGVRQVIYAIPEVCMRWYHAPANQFTMYMVVVWAIMVGILALLTHAFRLRSDQSILNQLWH